MDNREKILDVSLDLFYDKGYDAVSVQEIAEQAGITKPTLYYYFGSKYGLLEALLADGFDKLFRQLNPAMHSGDNDIRNTLFNVAKTFLNFAMTERSFFFFMLSLMYSARGNEPYLAVKPHLYKLYRSITELFSNAGGQLGNMNGRQETFAMGFLGFLNQYAFTFSEKHHEEDHVADEEVHALIQQFMYGIVT